MRLSRWSGISLREYPIFGMLMGLNRPKTGRRFEHPLDAESRKNADQGEWGFNYFGHFLRQDALLCVGGYLDQVP